MPTPRRRGLSLIELIVIGVIIIVLAAMLMPAIQASREASRKSQCQENLKLVGEAWLAHVNASQRYPTGGWGSLWVGEPERGNDRKQPGGWCYNVLPYMDMMDTHDLGMHLTELARRETLAERCATPIDILICPSRRAPLTCPDKHKYRTLGMKDLKCPKAAKTDYAANSGMPEKLRASVGPKTLEMGDDKTYPHWRDPKLYSGICFNRSEITQTDVINGVSNTYMVGEKYLMPSRYDNGKDGGDNENLYTGFNNDNCRSAWYPPVMDRPRYKHHECFGSVHPNSCNFLFCDGAVHAIPYRIDVAVHQLLAGRDDVDSVDVETAIARAESKADDD
jgi:prepilin-type processing-associated H-X9-DG protein